MTATPRKSPFRRPNLPAITRREKEVIIEHLERQLLIHQAHLDGLKRPPVPGAEDWHRGAFIYHTAAVKAIGYAIATAKRRGLVKE